MRPVHVGVSRDVKHLELLCQMATYVNSQTVSCLISKSWTVYRHVDLINPAPALFLRKGEHTAYKMAPCQVITGNKGIRCR